MPTSQDVKNLLRPSTGNYPPRSFLSLHPPPTCPTLHRVPHSPPSLKCGRQRGRQRGRTSSAANPDNHAPGGPAHVVARRSLHRSIVLQLFGACGLLLVGRRPECVLLHRSCFDRRAFPLRPHGQRCRSHRRPVSAGVLTAGSGDKSRFRMAFTIDWTLHMSSSSLPWAPPGYGLVSTMALVAGLYIRVCV